MSRLRKISSHYVWTPQGFLSSAILSFAPDGTLVEIETSEQVDSCEGVEFFSGVLIPGFVNAHCHSELSYLRGKIERRRGFAGFADSIARVRHEATPEERLASAAYWNAKMYQEGITAVGDICNGASTFPLKQKSPVYYHNFIEYFGLQATDFSRTDAVAAEAARLGLPHSATPHSTYSLQDKPFREIAHRDNPLSIHFMESPGEQELFEGRGRLHARNLESGVGIDFAGYGSPASRIVASVPPDKNILLIHNTFVDEEVIDRIESHFEPGRVTWVLCPRSNDFIEGAHPPATLLHRKGVRIAIGTDSLASNETLSMPGEMKLLPEISLHDRIRWATLTGAEALGLDSWAGSFTPGKRPGAILLTGIDLRSMTLRTDAASRRIV